MLVGLELIDILFKFGSALIGPAEFFRPNLLLALELFEVVGRRVLVLEGNRLSHSGLQLGVLILQLLDAGIPLLSHKLEVRVLPLKRLVFQGKL